MRVKALGSTVGMAAMGGMQGWYRLFVLMLATSPVLAGAVNWRLETNWEATERRSFSTDLPLVGAGSLAWRSRYDFAVSGGGAQLDLRFEPELDVPWQVRQAYYDGQVGEFELTLGRKSLHWDYGYLAHPLNMLGSADARGSYQAEPLIAVQRYRGISVDELVCTLRLEDRAELCVIRTQGLTGSLDWQLLAAYESAWRVGAGGSWVPGQRWEWHASAVGYQQRTRYGYPGSSRGLTSTEGPAWEGLVGANVSGSGGWQLWLEHSLDTRALSIDGWRRIEEDLNDLAGSPAIWSLAPAWQTPVLTRHRSMIRATQSWESFDFGATMIGFWAHTPTVLGELEISYAWTPAAELSLGWQSTNRSGILGRIGQSHAVTFGFNWMLAS